MHNNYIYIAVMALVSYTIRILPLTLIRKPIKNQFIQSFLYYVPYVTLSVMTFPAIVTDTHCIRLVNRIGLVEGIKDPKRVEMALWKLIPPEEGSDFCHRLVYHGREVCTARTKPYCDKCCLQDICAKADVE